LRSLTTLSEQGDFPAGELDQARLNDKVKQSQKSDTTEATPRGLLAFVMVVLALFSVGLAYGGFFERMRSSLSAPVENYLLNAGIILKKIHIKGQVNLGDEQVIAALGIRSGQSLFGFDAINAQKQLAKLGQIKTARVMRLLPSTLLVEIEERVPFARWLHDGQTDLVDRDGFVLHELSAAQNSHYPLVVGLGAGEKAAQLIRILSTHEDLAGRIKMAERVAQYRWNLHAKSGAVIKLPQADLALGLARFISLPDWSELLSRKNLVVDLRQPGQAFVREDAITAKSSSSKS
jgi:cell division protein FtsQ